MHSDRVRGKRYSHSVFFCALLLIGAISSANPRAAAAEHKGISELACLPGVERVLRENPQLLGGGSCSLSDAVGTYVLASGSGNTLLESGGLQSEAAAWNVAGLDAFRELTFHLYGVVASAVERDSIAFDGSSGTHAGEFMSQVVMEKVARISGVTTVGRWKSDAGECFILLSTQVSRRVDGGSAAAYVPRNERLDPKWRNQVLAGSETHRGGTAWVEDGDADTLLAVGMAELGDGDAIDSPAFSSRLRVAELQARAAAIRHAGLRLESVIRAAVEMREKDGASTLTSDFSLRIQAGAVETCGNDYRILDAGWWVSPDGRLVLSAKIVVPKENGASMERKEAQ